MATVKWPLCVGPICCRSRGAADRVYTTFVTHSLYALSKALPIDAIEFARHMLAVSTYLGHSCVADTYWYFQATPTLMAQVADTCQRHFEGDPS